MSSPDSQAAFGYEDLSGLLARMNGDEKHDLSAYSTLDVLWVLYHDVLRRQGGNPKDPLRDRMVISKGHGPMAFYAVLAAQGLVSEQTLESYGGYDSPLGWHPDRLRIPVVEVSSGSLGHGLAIAIGISYGLRLRYLSPPEVYCLLGDGELDEGSVHEAIALAARLQLGHLTAIVIDNRSSSYGWPGGIGRRFEVEGWSASVVCPQDHEGLRLALAPSDSVECWAPRVVVCEVDK